MRAPSICPKCHSKVAPRDTVCMDCGADLIDAKHDIVEQAKREARGGPAAPASGAAAAVGGAAAGLVKHGETAEEVRLREFDKQEAEKLRKQRPAQIVIILIALAGALVMAGVAAGYLKKAKGFDGVKTLSVAEFKQLGLNVFSDERVMFVVAACLAVAGLLCVIGEVRRLIVASGAIAAVDAGETPEVVHLSVFTQIGLILVAFFAPPLGLILGIVFKFSKDPDTRGIGSLMIYAALLATAILVVNWIWSLASTSLRQQQRPPARTGGGDEGAWLWRLIA